MEVCQLADLKKCSTSNNPAVWGAAESAKRVEIMTAKEVAAYMGVTRQHVCHLIRLNHLPASRLGGNWRLNRADVDRWRLTRDAPELSAGG
jgi:excisionase family DNA binding protein